MSTTYATLDTANLTLNKLDALGCSINFFADVCHIHRSTMAAHFSGKKKFSTPNSERLMDVAVLLEKLTAMMPVPPSFHPNDAEKVREALIKLEHNELEVIVKDTSDAKWKRALAGKF